MFIIVALIETNMIFVRGQSCESRSLVDVNYNDERILNGSFTSKQVVS